MYEEVPTTRLPLTLDLVQSASDVTIFVIGTPSPPLTVDFALSIKAGGNISLHKGRTAGPMAENVVLSRVTVGLVSSIAARLRVFVQNGQPYEVEIRLGDFAEQQMSI